MVRTVALRPLLLVTFFGLLSVACTRVKVEDVRGPGGGDWKAISCSRMNAKCFKTAARMCPNGYVFARAEEARAKSRASATSPAAPAASGEGNVTALPPQEEWRGEMYSKKPGKILVRCTTSAPKLHASRD